MIELNWIQCIRERAAKATVEPPPAVAPVWSNLPGIQAVVFDVYGTLFSSGVGDISLATNQDRHDAVADTLRHAGCSLDASDAFPRLDAQLTGIIKTHQASRSAAGIDFPEVNIHLVWLDFIEHLVASGQIQGPPQCETERIAIDYETRVNPVQQMPGLKPLLEQLQREGRVMGIVSNAQFFTPLLFDTFLGKPLEHLGFDPECCVWSYEMLEAKPSVRLYQRCAEALERKHRVKPAQVLYVGNDIRNDIWPAQRCGFRTALFAGDRLSLRMRSEDPDCREVKPDLVLTALDQIPRCIQSTPS